MTDANDDEFFYEVEGSTESYAAQCLSRSTYRELELHNLGGELGIFICSSRSGGVDGFDVLAKANGPDEAQRIVDALALLNSTRSTP